MKPEFSRQIFEKCSNTEFEENASRGTELFHACVRTDKQKDRHNEGNSRFSQFCERA